MSRNGGARPARTSCRPLSRSLSRSHAAGGRPAFPAPEPPRPVDESSGRAAEPAGWPLGRGHAGVQGGPAAADRDPDGATTTALDAVTVSTGLERSPDGDRAHYAGTATGRVDAFDYDYDEHGLGGRRPFTTVPEGGGSPDGPTVGAEGGARGVLYGGGVHRYAPDGTLDGVVELPVTKVTACAFGGPRLDRLFITTSREHLDPGAEPAAGALFACTPGSPGMPVREFAG
ncbi:SMP-30/gluconolactonase/LRE family protein [Streptomyces sp. MA15]|uniref:SMP-30/gluconolactonase/LRE family protein n=1 Tax=Streptomyces sp. MA15 TaxID=3055061 RepID=UPI0025B1ABCC|nr:SMP-30/gluconolactonase/LRE family protein [Streptomyces sp. MA15]MDN3270922.1 SMP-30/gluconolactonase/LRE family protein [Streptomyces sp. MA15]